MISRRRKFVFAMVVMLLAATLAGAAVLAADLYVHHRAEQSAGLNRWGYRGPVLGGKVAGEARLVMIGGSTVFGYGVPWNEAAPAFLEAELRKAHPHRAINVVNLGYNNEGAYAALPTLEDYRFLDYDTVILYEGYNDYLGDAAPNTQVYRRESVVYRWTGYSPILPLVLREKAMLLRNGGFGGDTAAAGKQVFRPNVVARTSATAMETANALGEMLGRQLERIDNAPRGIPAAGMDCAAPWSRYCESMMRAITYARGQGAKVLVVAQPIIPDPNNETRAVQQQASLAAALQAKFGADAGVGYLDLSRAIDLRDNTLTFDGMHLGRDGNERLATLLRPAVERLALASSR